MVDYLEPRKNPAQEEILNIFQQLLQHILKHGLMIIDIAEGIYTLQTFHSVTVILTLSVNVRMVH